MSHFNFVKRGRPYSINSKCIFSWLCKINMKNLRTITLRMFLIPWIKWKYYIIWDIYILHSIENTRRWRAICPIFCHYSFWKTSRGWKLRTRSKIAPSKMSLWYVITNFRDSIKQISHWIIFVWIEQFWVPKKLIFSMQPFHDIFIGAVIESLRQF